MRRGIAVTAAVFLASLIAGSAEVSAARDYIVALGASGIHGKGVQLDQAYPALLEAMLRAHGFDVQVINAGIDGDTTTGMLGRMDSATPAGTKITIFQPGSNDFRPRRGVSGEDRLTNIETIISRLRARQIGVVVCTGFPAEAAIAQRYSAIVMSCYEPAHLIDGQHLDPVGHQIVAARLLPAIEAMLRQR